DCGGNALMRTLLLGIRAALFYFGYSVLTVWFSVTGVLFCWFLPYSVRYSYLTGWNFLVMRWLRLTCGIRCHVRGRELLPPGPIVLMSKHQSQWETFFLQVLHPPIATVLKLELLRVPFFGWGLALLEPIAIDRNNPKQALKHILNEGERLIRLGRSVMIFPEGTRTPPGQVGNYARSGATLACKAGVPIVPVAHNAGLCWPSKKFLKYPGTIEVVIGAPIDTSSGDSRALTEQVKNWIEGEIAKMESQPR
ncbi:MAG TPA: lysophospholipid acyltransferase family protein, partial [Spongiibacteraceae bacterium]|nr:lysophospholipid acyltransferase family protein [Spongiibacteraceae bacterium]